MFIRMNQCASLEKMSQYFISFHSHKSYLGRKESSGKYFLCHRKLFLYVHKAITTQNTKVPQGAWNYITTLWHLIINVKSVSKWVSGETE